MFLGVNTFTVLIKHKTNFLQKQEYRIYITYTCISIKVQLFHQNDALLKNHFDHIITKYYFKVNTRLNCISKHENGV